MIQSITTFFATKEGEAILHFCVTLFGAACMYVFSLMKGFEGSVPFLKRMFPGRRKVFYDRIDFFTVNVSGAIIGTIFFDPHSGLEALAAGFGWVGAVNILLKPFPNDKEPATPVGPNDSNQTPPAT